MFRQSRHVNCLSAVVDFSMFLYLGLLLGYLWVSDDFYVIEAASCRLKLAVAQGS